MATQFVHSNNQSLLWKVINNTQQTINYFANAPPGEKEKWFQTIISHVYNQYNGQNISLKDINKRAIDFMLQSLQVQQTPSNVVTSAVVQPSVPYQSVPYQSVPYQSVPYQTVKSREQQLTDQFTRRQAEYESMVKKDVPTPHFTENVKDEAILDLGSAVKEYMKQRDQDIEIPKPADSPTNASLTAASLTPLQSAPASLTPLQSAPASLTPLQSAPASLTPLQSAPASLTPLKLNLNNAEPISLTVEELPTKKVQWGENTEHVFDRNESIILVRMEKEILEMKTKLEEILALLQK
jgi:hypothetical protein